MIWIDARRAVAAFSKHKSPMMVPVISPITLSRIDINQYFNEGVIEIQSMILPLKQKKSLFE